MTATHPDYAVVSLKEKEERANFAREQKERGASTTTTSNSRERAVALLSSSLMLTPSSLTPLSLTLHSHSPQLAARIAVSNLHKNTLKSFSET
jgi:hypothetical protein